jgi:hypothetical protein
VPLTLKRHFRSLDLTAAANGSNRIALKCPRSATITGLTCLDDLYEKQFGHEYSPAAEN